jgi:hypothetical protein
MAQLTLFASMLLQWGILDNKQLKTNNCP